MTEKQILQPISRSSPEKYSEGMAREEGALKTTTRRSFLTGAASAVAAATVASTTGAVASPLEVQPSSKSMGRTTVPQGYGMPRSMRGTLLGTVLMCTSTSRIILTGA